MRPFTLLIKPTSADCNLRCDYCFYLEKRHLYPQTSRHRMADEVLERIIKTYMALPQPLYSFTWQGGEPTLMGLEFFEKVITWQKQYGRSGARVGNALQTNATLITDELAAFLAKYQFLVGCSLDGPASLHDRYRRTQAGNPTYRQALQGIHTLRRRQGDVNILTLVSQANAAHAREVYRDLVAQGFCYHQYIPCVEFDARGELLPFAIQAEEWGDFLCALFDEWHRRDTQSVSIRHFDSILTKMLDGLANVCTLRQNCCQYVVVEYNGDVYPCDFFVEPQLRLGNILEHSWEELFQSQTYREFGAQKRQWHPRCESCEQLDLCLGDCLKHRIYNGNPSQNLSALCAGWQRFLRYSRPRFEKLAAKIRQQRQREVRAFHQASLMKTPKNRTVGRNDPCPCGSGKKFKKCCGA